jgi:hypothetical protein
VAAVAGAGAPHCDRNFQPAAGCGEGGDVHLPRVAIEVGSEVVAAFVNKQRVASQDKGLSIGVAPREMALDHFVRDRQETAVRTLRAFDPGFLADAAHPFVPAGGCVAGAAAAKILETPRINIFPSVKQGMKQPDFFLRRRALG